MRRNLFLGVDEIPGMSLNAVPYYISVDENVFVERLLFTMPLLGLFFYLLVGIHASGFEERC